MSNHPRFRQFYHREVTPHGVLLLSERAEVLLRGSAYMKVAPLLDGRHTTEELVSLLKDEVPAAEVLYALQLLEQRGHIVFDDGPREGPMASTQQAAFWELLGATPAVVAEQMATTTVSVHAFGGARVEPLTHQLESMGIRVGPRGDRWVALTDDYLQPGLGELDHVARRLGVPWMLVKPVGIEPWLGPVFVPGQTGCWSCLSQRLAGHRKAEAHVQTRRGHKGPLVVARAALPSTVETALGMAATEVARWIVEGRSATLEGRVISFDTGSLTRRDHVLTRRPQCPSCGDPGMVAASQRRPISLQRSPASFRAEGGYRQGRPEDMLARYEHHVSPITGLIGHVSRVLHRSGSELTPSYIADHNFAHADDDRFFLREGMRSRSGGKGKGDAQARASVVGESIERWSGVFQGDEARLRATLEQLGSAGIHPNEYMLFSERQLAERDRWQASGSRYTRVPARFNPAAEIEWSPIFPLRGGEPRYLPTACCYFGYGDECDRRFAVADSNGCAAGMTKEEAVLQGLLELCERDCTAMWWYCRARRPGVDLASFGDPYYEELRAYYESIHRGLWALDITNDLGIPTFAAVSHRTDKEAQDIVFGLGSHLDPKIALLRAVTELNQFLPAVLGVTEQSNGYNFSDEGVRFWKTATLASDPYLAPDDSTPRRTLGNYPEIATGDLREAILHCERTLAERGIDTYVLDQTRPDTGMHVVRVIAPGLRHFWPRFAPGRLYDVPVRMGWLPRPLEEHELNPISIFF